MSIYHLTVGRSGSKWIKCILEDVTKMKGRSGSVRLDGKLNFMTDKIYPLPENILLTFYVSFETFLLFNKQPDYKGFCILRDPRDILISLYFAYKNFHTTSHIKNGETLKQKLRELPKEEGMKLTIDCMNYIELFSALRSYKTCEDRDHRFKLFKFEDLIDEEKSVELFAEMFDWIGFPANSKKVLQSRSFQRVSGRKRGIENSHSTWRKGIAGDWKNHFTSEIENYFFEVSGDLVEYLGYESWRDREN